MRFPKVFFVHDIFVYVYIITYAHPRWLARFLKCFVQHRCFQFFVVNTHPLSSLTLNQFGHDAS